MKPIIKRERRRTTAQQKAPDTQQPTTAFTASPKAPQDEVFDGNQQRPTAPTAPQQVKTSRWPALFGLLVRPSVSFVLCLAVAGAAFFLEQREKTPEAQALVAAQKMAIRDEMRVTKRGR